MIVWPIAQLLELLKMKKYESRCKSSNGVVELCDRYINGDLNLEEAISELMEATPLDELYIRKMLLTFDRDNIFEFITEEADI